MVRFLHVLTNMLSFVFLMVAILQVWGEPHFGFAFTFLVLFVLFRTFSHTCWPFGCLLGKISLQFFRPFFISLFVVLFLSCMSSLYLWVSTPYLIHGLQIFYDIWFTNILYHSVCCLFIAPWLLLLLCRGFLVSCNPICWFFLLFLVLLEPYPKSCFCDQCQGVHFLSFIPEIR